MYNKLVLFATSTVLFAGSAIAGEIGVTNSYGNSFRNGTGTTNIQWTTNSQLSEQTSFGAIKLEKSSFDGKGNNGWGNGDDDAPGKSGGKNKAENGGNQTSVPFSDKAFAASLVFGTRDYTENTQVTGSTAETYSFGSTNFTHSVGAFSR